MKEIEVTITVKVPCNATDEEIIEWVKFETGYNGSISLDNPLSDCDMEAEDIHINI